jgi:hypothetical protein
MRERISANKRIISALLGFQIVALAAALGAGPRLVIDDDAYCEKVADNCSKMLKQGKLRSLSAIRREVHTKGHVLKLAPPSQLKVSPPELYDRLRESTLAVGSYYKCPDCGQWHFNGSAGFVVSQDGVVCTCCHVAVEEDEDVKESYLVAADSNARVFPVESVLAADTESDTCFLQIAGSGMKPLPLRDNTRAGERVYCLSHPGGYYFMFSEGIVARLNRKRNEVYDAQGQTNGLMTRPILFLNVTAEFAPGSSGGPVVDEAANVVGQVASIADAGEPADETHNLPASPSVPVRFCTASEEIMRLTDPAFEAKAAANAPRPASKHSHLPAHQPAPGHP